ncbi:hypothetical protein PR048_025807 [Dryococelus australis]|uniref:N-acetyltransferase domain-containing protein n=1 Tax=Dryococelus australis TaxID=614101 RepID=A0ABQ9GJK4_9NEOP|nr:hypothetical protein PR048_025807 [Dryococelus australis]
MSGDKGYSIRLATDSDMDSVVELLRHFFVKEEPINSSGPKPMDPTELYSLKFLGKGMSLVATSADGSVVGVCINNEGTPAGYADRARTKESTTNRHMKKVLTLLDKAEEVADIWNKYGIDRFFDVRIITVHGSMRGKGIGKALLEKSLQMAKERGYKLVHIECTGIYSARIAEQLGMECVFRIPYIEYKDQNGQLVFNVPEPHNEFKLFVMKL